MEYFKEVEDLLHGQFGHEIRVVRRSIKYGKTLILDGVQNVKERMNNIEYIRNSKKQLSFLLSIWLTGFVLSNLWIAVVSTKKCMNEAPPAFYGRWQDPPHDHSLLCVLSNIFLIIPCTGFKALLAFIAILFIIAGLVIFVSSFMTLFYISGFFFAFAQCLIQIPCMCGEEPSGECMHVV